MNKKLLRLLFLMTIITTTSILVGLSVHRLNIKSRSIILPQIVAAIMEINNRNIQLAVHNTKTVLIFFNSTCDHCHSQTQEIHNHFPLFKGKSIVFLSLEPMNEIRVFADSSKLRGAERVFFAHMSPEDAETFFESISIPTLFIYGADGTLKEEIKGEVRAETIVKHMN